MSNGEILTKKNRWVMASLLIMFLIYNIVVYTQGTSNNTPIMSEKAINGQQLYQENNSAPRHDTLGNDLQANGRYLKCEKSERAIIEIQRRIFGWS